MPRFPFSSFPSGCYAVAFSHELERKGIVERTFMGRKVVVFRGASGQPAMLDAHCPHMGASFARGGRVEGDVIRCPMHGFTFDREGTCTATGYGAKPPPTCRARSTKVVEQAGVVLAFHGASASWQPPAPDFTGFTPLRTHTFASLATHPQETTENTVDVGHLSIVHGYNDVTILEPLRAEGPYLTTRYRMKRRGLMPGTPDIAAEFTIHVHGLGYSYVEVDIPSHRMQSRHYVLSTPTDADHVDLRVSSCVRIVGGPLRFLPVSVVDQIVGRFAFKGFLGDVVQDLHIWENKTYIHPPPLALGDGPVGRYRTWTRQFYSEA